MDIIHADSALSQLRFLSFFTLDAVASTTPEYSTNNNDFSVTISETDWLAEPIQSGHFIFAESSEWGGRVEGIEHIGTDMRLSGPLWRGMLARKIVKPATGSAYRTITAMEANAAIALLLGDSLGTLFTVSTADSGIIVSGQYRYDVLLDSIYDLLDAVDARLNITFDGTTVTLSAMPVVDYSASTEMSQDYTAPVRSSVDSGQAYNHVIALGRGDLTARTVVERYRNAAGVISSTALAAGIDDLQFVLDYPNAENSTELTKSADEKLTECKPVEKVEIDLTETQNLNLGDIVGGRDLITGLVIRKPISQVILTVDSDGEKYEYKVGD